jgi:hypothetical protein
MPVKVTGKVTAPSPEQFEKFSRAIPFPRCTSVASMAFSSEVDTGSREENASKQESRPSVLILSEPKRL